MPAIPVVGRHRSGEAYSSPKIAAHTLHAALSDGGELALLDVRENGVHARDGHILLGVSAPLSQLELRIAALVPRRQTRLVVYDGGDEVLAARAAERLVSLGYTDVTVLEGGTDAWRDAGYELFTGVHVIGKAFGEFVEHRYGTPHLSVRDVKARIDAGENIVVLDSRPEPEFRNFSIPGALDLPGAELVYRFHEAVRNPDTLVVVNCAGRTRSIIGAQALINAGVSNPVVSLANGTMDWLIEGLALDTGKANQPPRPTGAALEQAKAAAKRLEARFRVSRIDRAALARFQAESNAGRRSLYLLDVRTPEEFEAGHLPGSHSAPGGQLVQQSGQWVGTRNARLVLIDDADGVRAAITASWLVQLNWGEVHVLTDALAAPLEEGPQQTQLAAPLPKVASIDAATLHERLRTDGVTVFDLDTSLAYEAGHIPGAHFAIRSRLIDDLSLLPGHGDIVLTSSDGRLAAFAAADITGRSSRLVVALTGGTAAWRAADFPVETGKRDLIHPFEDIARSAYQIDGDRFAAFREYLDWEIGLVAQLERDGTTDFQVFPPD